MKLRMKKTVNIPFPPKNDVEFDIPYVQMPGLSSNEMHPTYHDLPAPSMMTYSGDVNDKEINGKYFLLRWGLHWDNFFQLHIFLLILHPMNQK